ncbi:hypothetical protein J7348_03785 [Qipengyuania flava]|uniref:hypothetical protein n=1 Tax=Qipengyuania flava TaxID=192812 RepID=UPI001ADA25F6|nr:hypothetical protein [Qipengyuania flava]MBO9503737.1 hypothetical protein [Qipengyuania flava]
MKTMNATSANRKDKFASKILDFLPTMGNKSASLKSSMIAKVANLLSVANASAAYMMKKATKNKVMLVAIVCH